MPDDQNGQREPPHGHPELVVKVQPAFTGLPSASHYAPALELHNLFQQRGLRMLPLRARPADASATGVMPPAKEAGPLDQFFVVDAPEDQLEDLAATFRKSEAVQAAYIKPPASLAVPPDATIPDLNSHLLPNGAVPRTATPDYANDQTYLGPAPHGVDAHHAWTLPGGRGTNVRLIDVEGAWCFPHEDLAPQSDGLLGGILKNDVAWRNHGTAVMGTICGADNRLGIIGIAPESRVGGCSIAQTATSDSSSIAIARAAAQLTAGDILVIELHRPGPLYGFGSPFGQAGYIPVEWWEDDYLVIRDAVDRGVIVVEAAGNGAVDLDAPLYDTPMNGFSPDWRNPFRRQPWDSGAILVGAGAPPRGLGPVDYGPARSRLDFSNHGEAVDAQAWGRDVITSGYGDLQGGASEERWYTRRFSGTSSATPMVAAVLACLQGIRTGRGQPPLTPDQARSLLQATGTPQTDHPSRPASERIGALPDLRDLLAGMDAGV